MAARPAGARLHALLCAAALIAASLALTPSGAGAGGSCERDEAWATILVPEVLGVVGLTNEHRASMGLGPLRQSRSLTRGALWKAAHMAAYGYLEHDDPAPPVARTWDERVADCGYAHGAGENIAVGYGTPEDVMTGWLGSEGHRRNIEGSSYTAIGVGAAVADGTIYWAQVFGTQDDSAADSHSPPSATPDEIAAREDTAASIDVMANDGDAEGDPLGVTSSTQPSNGHLTVEPDGSIRYQPDRDFHGEDRFSYTVVDVFGYAAMSEVIVTVEPVNDAPEAAGDFARVPAGRRVVIDVVANDSDVDSTDLAVEGIVSGPTRGFATLGPDSRSITYRARWGTGGTVDRIVYEVGDGHGALSSGVLKVRIGRAR